MINGEITIDEIAEILTETVTPFYKGFTDDAGDEPTFRRSLTGDEVQNLLSTIHQIIITIRLGGSSDQSLAS